MIWQNKTHLDTARIERMFLQSTQPWPVDPIEVRVRYSRGSDFSGTCFYRDHRLHVNLGRHVTYPYEMKTYIAPAVTTERAWFKPLYTVRLNDAYELALFVLLHEFCHWLIKRARRNTRQKESMCDRFAVRVLVDRYHAVVRDHRGDPVPRTAWDIQDIDRFIASAMSVGQRRPKPPRAARSPILSKPVEQLTLFDL